VEYSAPHHATTQRAEDLTMHGPAFRFPVSRMAALALATAALGCAAVQGTLGDLGPWPQSKEATAADGLKEALRIGADLAVQRTSVEGGFLNDERIRIQLPDALRNMGRGLRLIGLGDRVDALDLAMNRAAESAAAEAKTVFWDAIRGMTVSDALGIVRGGDTAATQYFERTTRQPLARRFRPIVTEKMNEVGLARLYDDLAARYAALPLTSKPAFDLRNYVTDKALDGLFLVLGEEERKIRTDPAARVTPLLRRVFGSGS
jgi:hypothetical protein